MNVWQCEGLSIECFSIGDIELWATVNRQDIYRMDRMSWHVKDMLLYTSLQMQTPWSMWPQYTDIDIYQVTTYTGPGL